MIKKTFKTAPKPAQLTADEITAFEQGGMGHDDTAVSKVKPAAREPTKRLSVDLPSSTHRRFKTACTATGRKMVEEIQQLIEKRTVEMEAKAGLSRK